MATSQKAYEVLSRTLLDSLDSTLQSLWKPLTAQLRVTIGSPSLQAVVHTTVAIHWLGSWLSQGLAPAASMVLDAPVSSSAHVEDLVQIASDVVVTRAIANRIQLFLTASPPIDGTLDAAGLLAFVQSAPFLEFSLPWFPSPNYAVAIHTVLVHVMSWVVQLAAQDSSVVMMPITFANSSDQRIDIFFNSSLPQDDAAWPAWLGPQVHLQHVLDDMGITVTQAPIAEQSLASHPFLRLLTNVDHPTHLHISLRRPKSVDLLSSVPLSITSAAPSLVKFVHALPLEAMQERIAHKRIRLVPWGPEEDPRCMQLESYLSDLGCDVAIISPEKLDLALSSTPHPSKFASGNNGSATNLNAHLERMSLYRTGSSVDPTSDITSNSHTPEILRADTSSTNTCSSRASITPNAAMNDQPHPLSADIFTQKFLTYLDTEGQQLDLVIVHNNQTVLESLLKSDMKAAIIYFAPPAALERIANEHEGRGVVFLPVPVGYMRLMWAVFSALFSYETDTQSYVSASGVRLPINTAPFPLPKLKGEMSNPQHSGRSSSDQLQSGSSGDEDLDQDDNPLEIQAPIARPAASRESSGASLSDLMDSNQNFVMDQEASTKLAPYSPLVDPSDLPENARSTPANSKPASQALDSPTVDSPKTIVEDVLRTPIQRMQEAPDYFTHAVSQLSTQPTNSGLVIRSVDGRAAGIFFHPPTEESALSEIQASADDTLHVETQPFQQETRSELGSGIASTLPQTNASVSQEPSLDMNESPHILRSSLSQPSRTSFPLARFPDQSNAPRNLGLGVLSNNEPLLSNDSYPSEAVHASQEPIPTVSTELSLSNTTFHTESVVDALNVTDPIHGEKLYQKGQVLQPVGFETILGLNSGTNCPHTNSNATQEPKSQSRSRSVSVSEASQNPLKKPAMNRRKSNSQAPMRPPMNQPTSTSKPPTTTLSQKGALPGETPQAVQRPGAPRSIQLPPLPLPKQMMSDAEAGLPIPPIHYSARARRTSAQPQAGLLIGGGMHGTNKKDSRDISQSSQSTVVSTNPGVPLSPSARGIQRKHSSTPPSKAPVVGSMPSPEVEASPTVATSPSLSSAPASGRLSPTIAARIHRRKIALRNDFLPPVKVLVVEDNVINQRILSTFLRKRKIKHEIAKDGREAVDKWLHGDFHLILMDIQLPVMNGIEATKEIRRLESESRITLTGEDPLPSPMSPAARHSVIIVALTASVLSSDRVAALAAGCNDFLNKPVSLPWLQRKILEWGSMQYLLHAGRTSNALSEPPTPPTPGSALQTESHDRNSPHPKGSFDTMINDKAREVANRLRLSQPPHAMHK
ncbi:Two-component response regulator SSK1p [Malassezia yamatoensis]|uniref:Two-component response regulator SSK1p n=1 Tax=Malassezia yamatoensis TaxID=253288 RepID=A0AAJ5YV01_9BASI|nr:Two-component response regulator SSK1p [Malassezia yamatoensis]